MRNWDDVRAELNLSKEDEAYIELEKDLIRTLVKIREDHGLTQAQLAKLCNCKQSSIARMESMTHSPQLDSVLKIIVPLGYKLQIAPIEKKG